MFLPPPEEVSGPLKTLLPETASPSLFSHLSCSQPALSLALSSDSWSFKFPRSRFFNSWPLRSVLCSALLRHTSPTYFHALPLDHIITDTLHFKHPNLWSPLPPPPSSPPFPQRPGLFQLSYSNNPRSLPSFTGISSPDPSILSLAVTLFMFSLYYNHHLVSLPVLFH